MLFRSNGLPGITNVMEFVIVDAVAGGLDAGILLGSEWLRP